MKHRTFTDDELRARLEVEPGNTALHEEILRRFERDELGTDLRQCIAELETEVLELEKRLEYQKDDK